MMRPRSIAVALWCAGAASFAQVPDPVAIPVATPAPDITFQAPIEQIQLHVYISEVSEEGLRDLGANLTYKRFNTATEAPGDTIQQVNTTLFDPRDRTFRVTLPAPDQSTFTPPLRPDLSPPATDGIQTQAGAGLTFSLIEDNHGKLDGIFRSTERKGDVDLISKPELLVINGMTASMKAGGKVPFQDITYNPLGVAQLNVTFKDIGVNMQVTPRIRNDGMVEISMHQLDVTDVARIDNIRGVDLPVFAQRSQTGNVIVPNGTTAVIGGLSTRVERKAERRVPILGRVPLLGIPFRSRRAEIRNGHLLIFVAPTIVNLRDVPKPVQGAMEFWRDAGWQNEIRIEQEIEVMK